jgi:hypothetical protein
MRSFLVIALSCCFLFSCTKKEENAAPVPMTQPKIP